MFPAPRALAALGLSALVLGSLGTVTPAAARPTPGKAAHLTFRASAPRGPQGRPDRSFGPAQRREALVAQQRHAGRTEDKLGLGAREALHVRDVVKDEDGTQHVRYDRTYAGLPVIGGDLIVEKPADGAGWQVDRANDDAIRVPTTRAALGGAAAKHRAGVRTGLRAGATAPVKVVFASQHRPVLAWQTTVIGTQKDGTPIEDLVYTDATTGTQLARTPQVETVSGHGRSLYSGEVGIKTVRSHSRYQLDDATRGGHKVYNKSHKLGRTRGTLMTDADNLWGNGTTGSAQSAAVDAAYGAARTWDFYKSHFHRTGIRNNGKAAYSRVHFGKAYGNAFWKNSCFCMTYGDGDDETRPLVSLDIAGHEMSHGVTAATADLAYAGDAGGLNESTSDVMGTMVEFQAANAADPGDYLIGENVMKDGTFLRRMDDPAADGKSPSCWSPAVGSLNPHLSSGVGNHLFYLLAEGSGSKVIGGREHSSTTCNASTVTGIGRDQAAAIWYRALTTYWTSSTTYPQAAAGMVRAVRDLYGTGEQCQQTVDAWKAVGVSSVRSCVPDATPSGNLITNPGFEQGITGWSASPRVVTDEAHNPGVPAHRGTHFAFLGGWGSSHVDTLSRTVTLPAESTAVLTFFLATGTDETTRTGAQDLLEVQADGTTVATYSNLDSGRGYVACSVDLSAYAGQSVTLRFLSTEDADTRATAFLVDDTSLVTG